MGKVLRVVSLILLGMVLFLLLPALGFMLVENWSYGEAVYYSFITLTTIGFGDYVAGLTQSLMGQEPFHRGKLISVTGNGLCKGSLRCFLPFK